MRNYTSKRARQNKQYSKERKIFIQEQIDEHGWLICKFCGMTISSGPDIHHANGRDNEKILNKEDWFLGHNFCHVHQYHSIGWQKILWWNEYISRIKESHPHIYEKEIIRMSKNGNHDK